MTHGYFFSQYVFVFRGTNKWLLNFLLVFYVSGAAFSHILQEICWLPFSIFFQVIRKIISVSLGFLLKIPCFGAFCSSSLDSRIVYPADSVPFSLSLSCFLDLLSSFSLVGFVLLKYILSSFLRRVAGKVSNLRPCMSEGVYPLLMLYRWFGWIQTIRLKKSIDFQFWWHCCTVLHIGFEGFWWKIQSHSDSFCFPFFDHIYGIWQFPG